MTRKKYNRISKSITIRLLKKEKEQDFRRLVNLTLLYWTTDHLTGEKNLKDLILEIEGVKNA